MVLTGLPGLPPGPERRGRPLLVAREPLSGLVAGALARAAAQSQPTQVRAAFFANWDRYARGYFVNQIPASRLNVIDYAFAMPAADGTCALSDVWSDFQAPTWSGDTSVDGVA